jgi:catechol 2,3-dioxygenase-like lactoylglutathione lyase family enzyme
MLGASEVIAFVATTDAGKAKAFYREVLGLELKSDEPFALVFDANGTMIRVSKVREFSPAPFTVLGWRVPDIESMVQGLGERGVVFERFPGFPQDSLGIWSAPGAKVAWFKDPDGNMLSITQFQQGR